MSNAILHATDATFDTDVLKAQGLVLVDFWAEWCGPCKALAPVLADIAQEYDELRIVKVDADQNEATMQQQSVRGLPSLVLYRDGVEVERLLGVATKTRLSAFVEKHLEA